VTAVVQRMTGPTAVRMARGAALQLRLDLAGAPDPAGVFEHRDGSDRGELGLQPPWRR